MKTGDLKRKSYEFSLSITGISKKLEQQRQFSFASQLFRSGTSIGANIREAGNSESRADFIHKLKIAIKEAEETEYWLDLLRDTNENIYQASSHTELKSIIKMLAKSIITAKKNQQMNKL